MSPHPSVDWASPEGLAVMALDREHMPFPWDEAQWRMLDSSQDLLLLSRGSEGVRGFALYRLSPWEGLAHLLKVVLVPAWRGRGLAQTFWQEQCDALRARDMGRVYLEVATGNARAIAFYRKCGFQTLRQVPGFYGNGEAAWTMELRLGSSI